MEGDLDHPPIVITARRWTWSQLRFLLPAMFVALLASPIVFMPSAADIWTYAATAALGLYLVGCGLMILFPPQLRAEPSGLVLRVSWRKRRFDWSEVSDFRLARYLSSEWVALTFAGPKAPRRRSVLSGLSGADQLLVESRSLSIDGGAACDWLNRCRERWALTATLGAGAHTGLAERPSLRARLLAFPLGRVGRRDYWIAVGLFATIIALGGAITGQWLTAIVIGWGFSYGVADGRLRDLGWSTRWRFVPLTLALAAAATAAWTGSLWFVVVAGTAIPAGFLIFLGIAPGSPGPNRYGLRPGMSPELTRRPP